MRATAICKVLLCHALWNIASPEEEQGKEQEHKNGHDIALLTAQMDGQMEPGVNSTKDNHTAPKDSMRPQDREALTNPTSHLILQLKVTSRSHFLNSASTLQC